MNRNKEIVKKIYQAFAVGDAAAAFSHVNDKIEWTEVAGFPYAGTYHGHEAVIEGVFARLASEWEGWSAAPEEFVAEDQTVIVIGEYAGTCRATGKSFSAPYVHVWKFADDKAVSFKQHTDTSIVKQAMTAK